MSEKEQEPALQVVEIDGELDFLELEGHDLKAGDLLYLSPSVCEGKVTEDALERAVLSFEAEMGEDRPSRRVIELALTAALSQDKPK